MHTKQTLAAIVALAVVVAAGVFIFPKLSQAPVANDPKNATYSLEDTLVTLVNGISEVQAVPGSALHITTKYFGNEARGDLNGDGTEDTVFLLTQDSGGSGIFYYVVAALKTSGGYQGTNAIFLGDRIAPQTTEFREGNIIVNYADRAPGEPMTTAPSVGVSRYFSISNNLLVEKSGESPNTVKAHLGEAVTVLGIKITPLEVIEDSRCPIDVQCIQAGTVRLKVRLESGLGKSEMILGLDKTITTEAENISLTSVTPAPRASVKISPADYQFTFSVSQRTS